MGTVTGGIDSLAPQVTPQQPKVSAQDLVTFDFAVNVVKLNRAKAYVDQNAEALGNPKNKDYVEAVKTRYVEIGGLLAEQQLAGKAPKAKKAAH